ncbi:hypothetical protein B0T14DRAFT_567816 [Immersiella caudata]|uniref:Uncharacterized protein n=1 Tax=Immersiella caudata TaxID=314043 RepID=A0AA39WIU3_9PEZI|nr:hypothetical protein B0T14DRAFT_567816 [Immersiella caudata]
MSHRNPSFTPERVSGGEYLDRMQASKRKVCPGLIEHVSRQAKGREREERRVAVVELQQGESTVPVIRELPSSRSLARYLDKTASSSAAKLTRRRIFLVKGLPGNFIEVLGFRLKIPPALFTPHWVTGRYEGVMLNRMPRHYDPASRCTLRSPRSRHTKIQELSTDIVEPIYRMNTPFRRRVSRGTLFDGFGGLLASTERVSFWNQQSTSLPSLATLFVPVSLVAVIVSMGVPIAVLACVALFTRVGGRIVERISDKEVGF